MVGIVKKVDALYVAYVGDGTCILSKADGNAQVISKSYKMGNIIDWTSPKIYGQSQNHNYYQTHNHNQNYYTTSFNNDSFNNYSIKSHSLDDEMERIQISSGWIANNGLVNNDITRAFGYSDYLGSMNANPWIVKIELDFGDNNQENESAINLTPESSSSNKYNDEVEDINFNIDYSHGDEFLILANGAVLDEKCLN